MFQSTPNICLKSSSVNKKTMSIEKILEKNNEGVQCSRNRSYRAAKKALRTALVYLQEFSEQRDAHIEATEKKSCNCTSFPLIFRTCQIPDSTSKNSYSLTHFIFRNALLAFVNPNSQEKDLMRSWDTTKLKAMLIFNLSLICHCATERYDSKPNLVRVLRLYKQAWDTLQKNPWTTTTWHQVYYDAVVLGILNNMGATFHELAHYQQSQHCFKTMKEFFSSNSAGVLALKPDTRSGIMMNIKLLEELNTARAA
mmetsp:Transcript_19246/g.21470  ORF Transcript_19246/g.21470 Transcript_19246/m.21470 type:complete len:254 (+) Transcript_19246:95-856(+)